MGTQIHDSATVTGGNNPQGTVTFQLYPPSDPTCANHDDIAQTTTETLKSGSATTATSPFTTNAVGTYHWIATYMGDANNNVASTSCSDEPVTITKDDTSISTGASAGGGTGTKVFDEAVVSGPAATPSGTVTFTLYGPGDPSCSAQPIFSSTVPVSGGHATSGSFSGTSSAGTYQWIASYSGDAGNNGSSSGCGSEPVVISSTGTGGGGGGGGGGGSASTPFTGIGLLISWALGLIALGVLLWLAGGWKAVRRRIHVWVTRTGPTATS
jgi:hypothetical protein